MEHVTVNIFMGETVDSYATEGELLIRQTGRQEGSKPDSELLLSHISFIAFQTNCSFEDKRLFSLRYLLLDTINILQYFDKPGKNKILWSRTSKASRSSILYF